MNVIEFQKQAIALFNLQAKQNAVYAEYLRHLKVKAENVTNICEIPFLPVEFFKTHKVVTGIFEPEIVFTSSGTTGFETSRHFVKSISEYENAFISGFIKFYGNITDYIILALLPSYLEREGSSLVYMADALIRLSGSSESGFYLHNTDELIETLERIQNSGKKILLLGVSFALLELAEKYKLPLKNTVIMETGGMKGKRKEITRENLHAEIETAFSVSSIHSEYGMTEMLSQAYSAGRGRYFPSDTLKIVIRDVYDPLTVYDTPGSGGINIIDLANTSSCAFIATQDLGKTYNDGSFEVLGRFDNAQIRGCNLMVN